MCDVWIHYTKTTFPQQQKYSRHESRLLLSYLRFIRNKIKTKIISKKRTTVKKEKHRSISFYVVLKVFFLIKGNFPRKLVQTMNICIDRRKLSYNCNNINKCQSERILRCCCTLSALLDSIMRLKIFTRTFILI